MRTNLILLFVLSFSAAWGYILVEALEDDVTPLTMAACRALVGAIMVLTYCRIMRYPILPPLREWWQMLLIGLLGVGMLWSMISLGERSVDADLTTLLICVIPISTLVIVALPPKRVKVWWPAWVGALIAAAGLAIAIGPGEIVDGASAIDGVLVIVWGFASFAFANVLVETRTKHHSPAAVAGVSMMAAAAALWILAFALESPTSMAPSGKAIGQLVALGALGAAIPGVSRFMLVHRAGAVFASLYGYVLPVFGIVLASIVFAEAPSVWLFAGAPIAFAGVALLHWARRRTPRIEVVEPADDEAIESG